MKIREILNLMEEIEKSDTTVNKNQSTPTSTTMSTPKLSAKLPTSKTPSKLKMKMILQQFEDSLEDNHPNNRMFDNIPKEYFRSDEFIDELISIMNEVNNYGQYNEYIADILKYKNGSETSLELWKDIIIWNLREVFNIPSSITINDSNANILFNAIQESINLIDKHIFRSGDFEDWSNDIKYLINDWVSENRSQISKSLLTMLPKLDYSNVEGWAPKRR